MNKSAHINKEDLVLKAEALDNLFRLAESLGYPHQGTKLPSTPEIQKAFADTCGFDSFDNILELSKYIGRRIYNQSHFINQFNTFDFTSDQSKEFAHKMLHYIFVDTTKIILVLRALNIKPVNQQITQALIKYDCINNIESNYYVHPYFLIEYYKVALSFPQLDYIDPTMTRIYAEQYLKPEFKEYQEYGNHISKYFDPLHPNPEVRFQGLTTCFDAHPNMIHYEVEKDVLNFILKYSGRLNIQRMGRYVNRDLIDVALANLKYVQPNRSNAYINSCLKYRNNVNNDDQIITYDHDLFDHYFMSYYGFEFIKAIQHLHNESKCETKHELDLNLDDLITDVYGRFTLKFGLSDFTKYMFRYLRNGDRFDYEQGMAKIHSRIVANNIEQKQIGEFLPSALVTYINALYANFDSITHNKVDYMPYFKLTT